MAKTDEARELLDLVVREVSLVDRAANLRKFVVVKREAQALEDAKMGNFQADDATKSSAGAQPANQAEVEKGFPPDLMAAIKASAEWLKAKAGEEGAPKEAMRLAEFVGKVASGAYPAPGGYPYPEQNRAAKKDEVTADKAKAKVVEEEESEKARAKAQEANACGVPEKANKAKDEDVEKAKRVTKPRIQAIQESIVKLISMLHGVDEGAVAEALQKALPKADTDEEKSAKERAEKADSHVEGLLAGVQKAVEGVEKRIEAIEKVRTPSQSASGDSTVDVNKAATSFWKSVL